MKNQNSIQKFNSKQILELLTDRDRELIAEAYCRMNKLVAPSVWKLQVNSILSSVLGFDLNATATVLNTVLKGL